jgi:hypothetical protein
MRPDDKNALYTISMDVERRRLKGVGATGVGRKRVVDAF